MLNFVNEVMKNRFGSMLEMIYIGIGSVFGRFIML